MKSAKPTKKEGATLQPLPMTEASSIQQPFFIVKEGVAMPRRQTTHSAGYDIAAHLTHDHKVKIFDSSNVEHVRTPRELVEADHKIGFALEPGERALLPTGIHTNLPETHFMAVYPRSGVAIRLGLSLINCVGVIDADYQQEVMITLVNNSSKRAFITNGLRLAQAIIQPYTTYGESVEGVRVGGFGSTGG